MSTEARLARSEARIQTPGIIVALGDLGPEALISERALARLLGCHPVSVKRAVQRGELPPPVRFMGKPTWTAGAILKHFEARLTAAAEEREKTRGKIERLRP